MKAKTILSWITVILFLILAALPLYGMLIPAFNGDTGENRNLAAFPERSELSPSTFETWFNDNFALRGFMMKVYNRASAESGVEILNNVAIGKKDWLFYMADGSKEDIERSLHYSDQELEAICKAQTAAAEYLNSQGIGYYLMVCPDKHSIYPEYLPDGLSGYEGPSRFDGMADAIRENTAVNFVDTREAVFKEKRKHDVYYKTDTHWNQYGSFVGYDCLMELVEKDYPNVRRVTRDECTVTVDEDYHGGDMAGFIGQSETLIDTQITYTVNGSTVRQLDVPYETGVDVVRMENPDHPELPSAVIFRDSFTSMMYPMLNDSFSRVTYVWTGRILRDVVEYEKPDLVICEYVERYSGNARNGMDLPTAKLVNYEDYQIIPNRADIRSNVDSYDDSGDTITISGWAFDPTRDAVEGEKHIAFRSNKKEIVWAAESDTVRTDVTDYFRDSIGYDLDASGFSARLKKSALSKGVWEILIVIDDGQGHTGSISTGRHVKIK